MATPLFCQQYFAQGILSAQMQQTHHGWTVENEPLAGSECEVQLLMLFKPLCTCLSDKIQINYYHVDFLQAVDVMVVVPIDPMETDVEKV